MMPLNFSLPSASSVLGNSGIPKASVNFTPIEIDIKKASSNDSATTIPLKTFNSYSFERNILVPASAFRFTAPGVDPAIRQSIRSGDIVTLWVLTQSGVKQQIATGFIDETDTHIVPNSIEYVITGRDTLGQLIDNDSVDSSNQVIILKQATLSTIMGSLLANTRMPQSFVPQQLPNGSFLFQTNPGETKIASLQRYLELSNCLIWSLPDGRAIVGKPDFSQPTQGSLILNRSSNLSNVLEARVRRNVNTAIRQIVYQLQTLDLVNPTPYTKINNDPDMAPLISAKVGRSVFRHFSYGSGMDTVNTIVGPGNQSSTPQKIGDNLSLREIARDNMKILDVEMVVKGHLNDQGEYFDIDDVYQVQIPDDNVAEDMYVYSVSYELTLDHGMLTRLRLCRLGTICAYTDALARTVSG
jgi:prophage tail gpP-like protein